MPPDATRPTKPFRLAPYEIRRMAHLAVRARAITCCPENLQRPWLYRSGGLCSAGLTTLVQKKSPARRQRRQLCRVATKPCATVLVRSTSSGIVPFLPLPSGGSMRRGPSLGSGRQPLPCSCAHHREWMDGCTAASRALPALLRTTPRASACRRIGHVLPCMRQWLLESAQSELLLALS